MTPGPTEVPAAVRDRMAEPTANPDIESSFLECYRSVTDAVETIALTGADGDPTHPDASRDVVVLGGEGILGLEAAVASLVEPGDRVLCLSNGLYGDGFADFVADYGGEPVTCEVPWRETLDADTVRAMLEDADEPFDLATMVHCETPTGTLNDLEPILDVLEAFDVCSVVDAVSSLGGTPVPTDSIDVCLGASQKCFSAPPGLTTCAISDRAWDRIDAVENRSYYLDLEAWRTVVDDEWFPYTHLSANVAGLETALELLLEEGLGSVFDRHERVAARCRDRATDLGLETFPADEADCSPTVTALEVDGRAAELQQAVLAEHDIVLATGLGDLADDVLRIGHMGHNARDDRVDRTMDALADVL
ncbi:pyridoxal-phosphate-dependent aminotransferase family protein [Natrarchaeobaculum sulfurireducens]|uniref:Serine--glyoxylate aminotransferase n=1 Tax=Natrarchaeobaculum sulfurireducens TaxID=2044521 RepID=A0A346PCP9_9EURY|nr:aminotransferase class V-fold PLP-dependent enzyme [Natrarchaeobaculum sulfurireducens]AXR77294.1 Serine-pyruvate aminotransferase/archaeal aspartate aminotransferase [Natrarchaeobaculum sulfurireducens]AXR82743.1 Serine--glyoxylate aminotransferase [Natrarchaeobaculum sulfurireducens]